MLSLPKICGMIFIWSSMKPVVKCHVVESSIWAHPINIDTIDDVNVNGNINGNVKGNVNGNVNDNVNGNVNGNVNVNVNGNVNDNIKDNINNSFWLGSSELQMFKVGQQLVFHQPRLVFFHQTAESD